MWIGGDCDDTINSAVTTKTLPLKVYADAILK